MMGISIFLSNVLWKRKLLRINSIHWDKDSSLSEFFIDFLMAGTCDAELNVFVLSRIQI